jgi:hypothetical protein
MMAQLSALVSNVVVAAGGKGSAGAAGANGRGAGDRQDKVSARADHMREKGSGKSSSAMFEGRQGASGGSGSLGRMPTVPREIASAIHELGDTLSKKLDAIALLAKSGDKKGAGAMQMAAEAIVVEMRAYMDKLASLALQAVARANVALAKAPESAVQASEQAAAAREAAEALELEARAAMDLAQALRLGVAGGVPSAETGELAETSKIGLARAKEFHKKADELLEMPWL